MTQPASSLRDRSFVAFTATQYLGAFNDNVFKQMILLFSLGILGHDRQGLATVIFALPFILFSGLAGQLSERHAKVSIMRISKIGELVIMLTAVLGFLLQSETFLLFSLFLMGAQSAFFGPAKYGAIPEIIEDERLVDANGVVQMTTFLAIILGQALAGWLLGNYRDALHVAALYCVGIAVLGIVTVYLIRPGVANRPGLVLERHPFSRVWATIREIREDTPLFMALIAGTFFFFSGALVQLTVNNYGMTLLSLGEQGTSMLLVRLAVGIMLGCIAAGPVMRLLSGKWTIFTGAMGVAVSEFLLSFHQAPLGVIHWLLIGAGFFTGLYYVPIATFMQSRPKLGKKGEVLAAYNFCNFVGILMGGIVWQLLIAIGITANNVWYGLSGMLVVLLVVMFPHLRRIE